MELLTNLAASYTTRSGRISSTANGFDDVFVAITVIISYGFLLLFIFGIYYIVTALLMSSLFKKASVKKSSAWVPFYRYYRFLQIGGQNGRLVILSICAVATYIIGAILAIISAVTNNIGILPVVVLLIVLGGISHIVYYIFRVIAAHNISKKLGKDSVVTIFYIISEFIWWAIAVSDKNVKFDDKLGSKRLDK